MIWKQTCFHPRNIDLAVRGDGTLHHDDKNLNELLWMQLFSYHSALHPPTILHTNQESRKEGLKWYSLSFGILLPAGLFTVSLLPYIYIN